MTLLKMCLCLSVGYFFGVVSSWLVTARLTGELEYSTSESTKEIDRATIDLSLEV